ncbi:MAG: hypothetical protein DRN25_04325 [Thermoplasmata archaeon]|nr:MAG: hypothetical protein DRN25_04325 [Thermoplasmata archaeon]
MKMKNRAVSPVISVILLVAVAIGVVALAYSWFTSLQRPIQESGTKLSARHTLELSGQLKIESIYVNTSGNSTIYLRNVGSIQLSNFTLYINGNLDKIVNLKLDVGELGNITTRSINKSGETYMIKIVSAQGASAVKSIVA